MMLTLCKFGLPSSTLFSAASPSPTEPTFSTTVQAAQGNQTATGPNDSAGTPTASALPSASSHTGAGVGTPTCPQGHRITSLSAVSQSSRSQDPVHTTTHLGKPPEVTDLALTTSHRLEHGSTPTHARSQGIPRPSVTNSGDPRGTTQSSEHGTFTLRVLEASHTSGQYVRFTVHNDHLL